MITPARSLFIGILAGLLGLSVVGLVVTLFGPPVTVADLWLGWVFLACAAGGGAGSEVTDIRRQLRSDAVGLKERLAKIAPVAVVEVVEPAPAPTLNQEAAREHYWKVALLRAVMYAELYDWPFDTLGPEGVSVMDRADWDAVTDHLRDCAILVKRERSRTRYYDDWGPVRARGAIRQGLPLPYPAGPAPVVHSPRCTEAQLTQFAQTAQTRQATRDGGFPPKEPAAAMPGGQRAR